MTQDNSWQETLVEQYVTYTLVRNGKLFVIENVPARVSLETGEQLFSAETVERLQQILANESEPVRVIEAPVYDYAA